MAKCIKPRPGLRVLDPRTMRPIPEDGITVRGRVDPHYLRREKAGDVTISEVPDQANAETKAPAAPGKKG